MSEKVSSLRGTSDDLIEGIVNDLDKVLLNAKGLLTTMDGGKIPPKVVIPDAYPETQSFVYHVELKDSPDRLRQVFSEADCLKYPKQILDCHIATFGSSRPAQSPVASEAPMLEPSRGEETPCVTGDGVPKSKTKLARRSTTPCDEKVEVLKVRLFIECQRLMLRYEKVYPDTTGHDIKRRLWEKLPEKYQDLDCHLFLGGSSVQLELHEKLMDNLRPTEIMTIAGDAP